MKTAHVKFKNSKYNYFTSVNPALTDEQIKDYFIGTVFNLGGMGYDHKTDKEVEIDNLQQCIDCEVL